MRRLLILFLFITLVAAACGGDDSAADGGSDTDTTADDDGGDDSADDDSSSDDDSSGDDDDDSSSGDDDDDSPPPGEGSDFCDFVDDQEASFDFDSLATPDDLSEIAHDALDSIQEASSRAPADIRDTVERAAEEYEGFIELMDEADWNFLAVDPDDPRATLLEDSTTFDELDAYCGGGGDSDGGDPGEVPDVGDFLDPDVLEDLENIDPDDAEALARQFYQLLGHDEETAQCLLDELGEDFDFGDAGAELLSQEVCGLTLLEIFTPSN